MSTWIAAGFASRPFDSWPPIVDNQLIRQRERDDCYG